MANEFNSMEYMNPMFADIFAAYGIGGTPVNLQSAAYQRHVQESAAVGIAPLSPEELDTVQRHVRAVAAQARLKSEA